MSLTTNAQKLQLWLDRYKVTAEQYHLYLQTKPKVQQRGEFITALQELLNLQFIIFSYEDMGNILNANFYYLAIDGTIDPNSLGALVSSNEPMIVFNSEDGLVYIYDVINNVNTLETFNPANGNITSLPTIGYTNSTVYASGITKLSPGLFLLVDNSGNFYQLTTAGVLSQDFSINQYSFNAISFVSENLFAVVNSTLLIHIIASDNIVELATVTLGNYPNPYKIAEIISMTSLNGVLYVNTFWIDFTLDQIFFGFGSIDKTTGVITLISQTVPPLLITA